MTKRKQFGFFIVLFLYTILSYAVVIKIYTVENTVNPDHDIYTFNVTGVLQSGQYRLSILDKHYPFTVNVSSSQQNSERIFYVPLSDSPRAKNFTVERKDRERWITVYQGKLPLKTENMVKIRDYLIKELRLSKVPSKTTDAPESQTSPAQVLLLEINISVDGNTYWISPKDPDWGWIYHYVYFLYESEHDQQQVLSGDDVDDLGQVEVADKGKRYYFYNSGARDRKVRAVLSTKTYEGKVSPALSQVVELKASRVKKEPVKETKIYQIPIYLNVHEYCEYLLSFINGKMKLAYQLEGEHTFKFYPSYPDTNLLDHSLEFFTSSFPYGQKLIIGVIDAYNLVEKPKDLMDLNVDFVKEGRLDHQFIDVDGYREAEVSNVDALLKDTLKDFDIDKLKCHVYDSEFQVTINCDCELTLLF